VYHDSPAFPIGLQDARIVKDVRRAKYNANADKIEMSCHVGTHIDGPWHFVPESKCLWMTIDQIPLVGKLIGEGVIADISGMVEDYGFYGKDEIMSCGADVRKGDILFVNTGYHKYQFDQPEADEIAYFFRHPGPKQEFADWCLEMDFNYLGVDGGSMDHPHNTGLQKRLEREDRAFCEKHGVKDVTEIFPRTNWQLMHNQLFAKGCIHIENLGGEIDKCLNKRCILACYPLKLNAESSPCRVVAYVKKDQ
jgi:kynurenine formamidase